MGLSTEAWILAGSGALIAAALWAIVLTARQAARSLVSFSRTLVDLAVTLRGIEARLSELRDLIAAIRSSQKNDG